MRFSQSFLASATLAFAACAAPVAEPVAEEPAAEAAATVEPVKPKIELIGPVKLVDAPARLRAQKVLSTLPNIKRVRLDDNGEVRLLATYGDVLSTGTPTDMAIEAIALYSEALGFEGMDKAGIASRMVLDRVVYDDSAMHVRLRQVHMGITMDDRSMDVHVSLGEPARLLSITGSGALPAHIDAPEPAVSEADALAEAARQVAPDVVPTFKSSLRYVDVAQKSVLAYRIEVRAEGVSDTLYINANDNKFIRKDEVIKHGSAQGYTFPSNAAKSGRAWLPLSNMYVSPSFGGASVTSDENGSFFYNGDIRFSLQGPYVRMYEDNAANTLYSYEGGPDARVSFEENSPYEAQLSMFIHTNMIHDYLKDNFGYTGMDRQLPVHTHANICNAYADPENWEIRFGTCGTPGQADYWDLGLSGNVNVHEYVHLVADDIVKLKFSCGHESGAYGEGMSDYFACAMYDDPKLGEDSKGMMLRSCENTMKYARDYNGECHDGAFLFSGSMWDLRKTQGKYVTDALAFWSMYYTPEKPTLIDVRDAVIAADNARFGGTHTQSILTAFSGHGVNDDLVLFVTTDNPAPLFRPFEAVVVAHAQGFDRKTVQYDWSFDDGATAKGDEVAHTFREKEGWAKVTVSDADGTTKTGEVHFASACASSGSPAWLVLAIAGLFLSRRKRA